MSASYRLSFFNGPCRYTRANDLAGAVHEAITASYTTGVVVSLLDDQLSVLGKTCLLPNGVFVFNASKECTGHVTPMENAAFRETWDATNAAWKAGNKS